MTSTDTAAPSPLGLGRVEASIYIGISPSEFDRLIRDGKMPRPVQADRHAIWDVAKLSEALISLQAETGVFKDPALQTGTRPLST